MPPRSISASVARTPSPPPLVRIASRSPGRCAGRRRPAPGSRPRRTARPWRTRAACRRAGRRRRRPHPSRRARRYGNAAALRRVGPPPGLHDQDRLGAGGGAGRRHELARVGHPFDIEQDRPHARVLAELVQQVAEIDVGHAAHRDQVREADPARCGPVEQGRHDRARLGEEGEVARPRAEVGEARVEPDARHQEPDAVRTEDAQQVRPGGIQHRLAPLLPGLGAALTESGRQHHRRAGAALAEFGDEARHGVGRRRDHRQIGCDRQGRDAGIGEHALDCRVARVDRQDRTLEAALQQVARRHLAHRARRRRCADEGDGGGREQAVEIADGHRRPVLRMRMLRCNINSARS